MSWTIARNSKDYVEAVSTAVGQGRRGLEPGREGRDKKWERGRKQCREVGRKTGEGWEEERWGEGGEMDRGRGSRRGRMKLLLSGDGTLEVEGGKEAS